MKDEDMEPASFEDELEQALVSSLSKKTDSKSKKEPKPKELYVLPLQRRPFFPGMAAPVVVEAGPYYEILKKVSKAKSQTIGLVLTKSELADTSNLTFDDLYEVGVMGRIMKVIPMEQGGAQVIFNMESRITIKKPTHEGEFLKAKVAYYEDDKKFSEEIKAYSISIISTIKELLKLNPLFKEELQIFLSHSDFTEPGKLADFAAALTTASREDLQGVLETFEIHERIDKSLRLLKKELDISQLQFSISQKIDATINKSQREYFLREQLKTIKKELGLERDDKLVDREKYEQRINEREVPDDVMKVIDEELDKFSTLDVQSAEYSVSRGYLDWLTNVPWGMYSDENHDISKAQKILEHDHYGLKDIKERILEFISIGKLSGGLRGSIICLVGPPGVGKTSIGRSIARALNRKFYRFSVGGMRDEAEIKGHRRTYIGAMPGKVVQALKVTQTMNPVIMLDEVDKLGKSYQGDPASALLEVLDPEQNSTFLDHYLDVPCNLSDVLFILTANVLDSIPEPLLDRMDVMRLSGYIMQEKIAIAKKYLIPRNRKQMGLKASNVNFTTEGLRTVIEGYARESGVRGLEKQIKKILRKVAVQVVKDMKKRKRRHPHEEESVYRINKHTVEDYLGKPEFTSDRFYKENPIGVSTGLAWTALGGATLYIEAIKVAADKTEMKLTGQAGDVMKESAQIAWSYLHSALHKYAPGFTFFEKAQVHIHIPEGATPKDGPSAGITMVTALLSLLLDTPVLEDLGMTGEITLTGRVLPIGGMKEKVVAAKRSGLKTVIFPKENLRDYDKLPEYIKQGLTFHFVEHFDEVFSIAFPEYVYEVLNPDFL